MRSAGSGTKRGSPRHGWAVSVLVIGLVITASLTIGARVLRDDDEQRLLRQRAREAAALVTASTPGVQTPLASAAVLAETTDGDPDEFLRLLGQTVATRTPFISASLWRVGAIDPQPIEVLGVAPDLARAAPEEIRRFLRHTARTDELSPRLLDGPPRRIGYAITAPGPGATFVAYGEAALRRSRRAVIARDAAFADLDYALYLGPTVDPDRILASSTGGRLPLDDRRVTTTVPFGDTQVHIVLAARSELGSTVLEWLPWTLLGLGIVITLAAAGLTEWLNRRREHAESLASALEQSAAENARLLAEQRSVASTLQHSLLPERLPDVDGIELGVRYAAGVEGIEIGGDWYDVVTMDDGGLFFVVGDVSGRGLRAATVMASLRYAIRAYVAQGDDPATVLTKLSTLLNLGRDGSFATALCGTIDVEGHSATLASAGHPYPLLVTNGHADWVTMNNGVPVGVAAPGPYEPVTAFIPPNGTLLAFTDGLVERRDELLDVGFERLRNAAIGVDGSLDDLLTKIAHDVAYAGAHDDSALLGIRWTS